MPSKQYRLLFAGIIAGMPIAAYAQQVDDEPEIVVIGQRERGSVVGDIKPELQLRPADIRALGVGSVTELLAELAPQLRSGQGSGQPIVLLEGKRISGFREIATLPAEAIARVDILPEEVALKYGYPSGQKVVNIVLRQRFKAFTVELEDTLPTAGGANAKEGSFDFLRIQKGGRVTLHVERKATDQLLESQRGIDDGTGSGQYRTLLPANQQFTAGATLARTIAGDISATLNGELATDDSVALSGLSTLAGVPLRRINGSQTAHAGTTLNGTLQSWRWTFTGNYDHGENKSFIDRGLGTPDIANSVSNVGAINFTANGSPLKLPAGDVSTTLELGASFSGFDSSSVRLGVPLGSHIDRDIADGQINIDVPVTSRKNDVLAAIGDLSINGNYAARRLSDYGSLRTFGYGVTWSPLKQVNLIASYTDDEVAPTAQQLGNPVIATPGVRVFDFVRGETAIVTQITGGNSALTPSDRHVLKFGATIRPFEKTDITLTGDFVRTQTDGNISSLPPASLASQMAFPGRYVRDTNGVLVSVDSRSVNFARTDESQFRWGINFSKPLTTSQSQIDAMRAAFQSRFPSGSPGRGGNRPGGPDGGAGRAGGPRPPGGGGGGPFGGGGGGRLSFAIYHTLHLTDSVRLRDGLPVVDLLNGGTIGSGGQPRHEIEVQAGLSKNGFGARLTGNWQSATRVIGATPADDLRFSDLGTINLRLFANVGQMPWAIKSAPWLRGARITIGVNNLLDSRQRVTDGTGATPLSYQPGYLDPLGRTIRISIRKMLF